MQRLLKRAEVATLLGTSEGVAISILAEHGVHPVDFGTGRGRGCRWLSSAVEQALMSMHDASTPKQPAPKIKKTPRQVKVGLASMSVGALQELLTGAQCVQ